MKLTDYPKVATLTSDNIFIIDGPDGTRGITAENVISEVLENQKDPELVRTKPVSFTILASSWVVSTTYEDYEYQSTMTISGLTPNDLMQANFDLPSLLASQDNEIAAAGDTLAGTAIFYAKSAPTSDLTGMYVLFKGA